MHGGAEEARLLHLRHLVERAHHGHRLRRPHFHDRPAFEDLLHLGGGAERGEAPGVNQRDAVAALRFVEVVGRDEDRHALLRERVDETPELAARQRIDAARRLIEEENRRFVQDRAAERQALPPAARQIARQRVLPSGETGHLEHEAPARGQPLGTQSVDAAKELDVLVDGQQLVEREALRHVADSPLHAFGIGRHVDAADRGGARRRPQEAAQHPDGGGLAGAVAAQEAEDLAATDVERQPVDGEERAESSREVPDVDGFRGVDVGRCRHEALSGRRRERAAPRPAARSRARAYDRARPAAAPSARRALRCS